MRIIIFYLIFFIYSFSWSDEKDVLNRVIPRFKVSGPINEVLMKLKEETIRSDPDIAVLNVIYFPEEEDLDSGGLENDLEVNKPIKVILDFEGLTVIEIVKSICIAHDLRYKVENNIVSVMHPSEETDSLVTQFYSLSVTDIKQFGNGGAQKFLESQGVAFNTTATAKYISSLNKVIVINTSEEQAKASLCFLKFGINEKLAMIEHKLSNEMLKKVDVDSIKKSLNLISQQLKEQSAEPRLESQISKLEKKLAIIIPKVRFIARDIDFISDFIRRTTRNLDEEGEGLNVIFSLGEQTNKKKVNLELDDVSVLSVIKFSCKQLGLSFNIVENTVVIKPTSKALSEIQMYEVSPYFLKFVQNEYKNDFKQALVFLGIKFSLNSKVSYVKDLQRLVVSNTSKEHEKLKELLDFFYESAK